MRVLLLICVIIVSATFTHVSPAKAEDENFTFGATNGRLWLTLTTDKKIILLQGIYEGACLQAKELRDERSKKDAWQVVKNLEVKGFHMSEVAKQVDEFYSDSANLRIPIMTAYQHYAIAKMKGATSSELEQTAADLRKGYSQETAAHAEHE